MPAGTRFAVYRPGESPLDGALTPRYFSAVQRTAAKVYALQVKGYVLDLWSAGMSKRVVYDARA